MLQLRQEQPKSGFALAQRRFRPHRAGHVEEGENRAGDEIVHAPIGVNPRDIVRSIPRLHLALRRTELGQHLVHVVAELGIGDPRTQMIDRAADIGLQQVKDLRRGRSEAPYPKVVVEEDRRDLR